MNQQELLKQAFMLGVIRAGREAGLEKTAIPNLLKYVGNAWKTGQGSLGKTLSAGRFATYGGGPMHEAIMSRIPGSAKKYVRDAIFGGTLGGAMNVATGDSSTPWYERYGQGALGGAISGAAFRGGIEGTRGLMGAASRTKWLGSKAPGFAKRLSNFATQAPGHATAGGILNYAKSPGGTMGETAKRVGMYALGGVPLAAAGMYGGAKGEEYASKLMGGGISPESQVAGVAAPAAQAAYSQLPYNARYAY